MLSGAWVAIRNASSNLPGYRVLVLPAPTSCGSHSVHSLSLKLTLNSPVTGPSPSLPVSCQHPARLPVRPEASQVKGLMFQSPSSTLPHHGRKKHVATEEPAKENNRDFKSRKECIFIGTMDCWRGSRDEELKITTDLGRTIERPLELPGD